jgi:hypothetical protein
VALAVYKHASGITGQRRAAGVWNAARDPKNFNLEFSLISAFMS